MAKFLSNAWFDLVAKLNNESAELNLPPAVHNLTVAIHIKTDNEQLIKLHLKEGKLHQGGHDHAKSTIVLDQNTLQKLIHDKDTAAVIGAFMTGKIRVEGDMSALLSLQSARPTPEQKALYKAILAQTEFDTIV